MAEYFLHYTSRQHAQEIIAAGRLHPGRGGRIYLTQDLYGRGADAAQALAITNKAVEVACVIPADRIYLVQPTNGRHVGRLLIGDQILRPGSGTEWYTETEIDVNFYLTWLTLDSP